MSPVTDVMQKNILGQLDISKKLFDIIPRLAKVAEEDDSQKRKARIQDIMQELLEIGEKLSDDANAAGMSLTTLVRRPD